jgi:hypothetical protein
MMGGRTGGARWGPNGVLDRGLMGCPMGPDGGSLGDRRGPDEVPNGA